ncbi:hypothetical protein LZ11_01038 [Thermosediminibacter litoriperuensis]|uniref:Uncharacterized protein n=1 Tax=Thermosediminibacter litoriperuensis TaxID=291989 RepID=A0A5S5AUH7_9FIRM|nr:hypothetical protein LZ11_01038 [Thermosediminibacter litoriperuensis]
MSKQMKIIILFILIWFGLPIIKNLYDSRVKTIDEAVDLNLDKVHMVEIIYNNQSKVIQDKENITELISFFRKY